MIKVDEDSTEIEGNAETIMAELTYAIFHVTNSVAEKVGKEVSVIEGEIYDAVKIIRLADAGMDIHEANEIVRGVK